MNGSAVALPLAGSPVGEGLAAHAATSAQPTIAAPTILSIEFILRARRSTSASSFTGCYLQLYTS